MICKSCNKEIPYNSRYCHFCGFVQPNKAKLTKYAVFFTIIAGVLLYVIYSNYSNLKSELQKISATVVIYSNYSNLESELQKISATINKGDYIGAIRQCQQFRQQHSLAVKAEYFDFGQRIETFENQARNRLKNIIETYINKVRSAIEQGSFDEADRDIKILKSYLSKAEDYIDLYSYKTDFETLKKLKIEYEMQRAKELLHVQKLINQATSLLENNPYEARKLLQEALKLDSDNLKIEGLLKNAENLIKILKDRESSEKKERFNKQDKEKKVTKPSPKVGGRRTAKGNKRTTGNKEITKDTGKKDEPRDKIKGWEEEMQNPNITY
jgi:hypothetical protein